MFKTITVFLHWFGSFETEMTFSVWTKRREKKKKRRCENLVILEDEDEGLEGTVLSLMKYGPHSKIMWSTTTVNFSLLYMQNNWFC